MDQALTLEALLKILGALIAIGGIWWKWQAAIAKVDRDLQDYKLHVAETYAAKASVYKQFEAVTTSITDLGKRVEERLDGMNGRFDRFLESKLKDR